MICCPWSQRSTLKAPEPAGLRCRYSAAHGSFSVACFRASLLLMISGIGTAMSGRVSFDGNFRFTRKVASSTATNCSGSSRPPAPICVFGKPPSASARSNDHFTSAAVTFVPSQNFAFGFSLKSMLMPSGATVQLSASSPFSVS